MPAGTLAAAMMILAGLQTAAPPRPTVPGAAALVRALRSEGVMAARRGRVSHEAFPFFAPRATRLSVAGEDVHVFEFPSADAAGRESSHISPGGSPIGAHQITWMAPPRFYRKDRLIVLYVGSNLEVAQALESILGPPFPARPATP